MEEALGAGVTEAVAEGLGTGADEAAAEGCAGVTEEQAEETTDTSEGAARASRAVLLRFLEVGVSATRRRLVMGLARVSQDGWRRVWGCAAWRWGWRRVE